MPTTRIFEVVAGPPEVIAAFTNVVWSAEATTLIPRPASGTTEATITPWAGSTNTSNPIRTMVPAWTYVKCAGIENGEGSTSGGLIYTVDPLTIPGGNTFSPSLRTPYVFAFEARPSWAFPRNNIAQTDFYFERTGTDDQVLPANHWGQHWVRIRRLTDNGTYPMRVFKWLYPCRDGHGSCATNSWILGGGENSYYSQYQMTDRDTTGYYFTIDGQHETYVPDNVPFPPGYGPPDQNKIGFTDSSPALVYWDEWVLMKWHLSIATDYGDGTASYNWEVWYRRPNQAWVKVADFRPGVTPTNWDWRMSSRGHNALRVPSTVGWAATGQPAGDMMFYAADFVVALNEADLPVYPDQP